MASSTRIGSTDARILEVLQREGRRPYADLGADVGISGPSVHERVKKLESRGVIRGYAGIDEIQSRYGEWIIDGHFPPVGHGTQPVEAGYMANAWLRLKHPDYDQLREMLDAVGRMVTVRAR